MTVSPTAAMATRLHALDEVVDLVRLRVHRLGRVVVVEKLDLQDRLIL